MDTLAFIATVSNTFFGPKIPDWHNNDRIAPPYHKQQPCTQAGQEVVPMEIMENYFLTQTIIKAKFSYLSKYVDFY